MYISRIGPDVTPPRLIGAYVTTGGDRVILEFSEAVDRASGILPARIRDAFEICVLNKYGCPQADEQAQSHQILDVEKAELLAANDLLGGGIGPCQGGDHVCLLSGYGVNERRVIRLTLDTGNPIQAGDQVKLSFDHSDISPEELTDAAGNDISSVSLFSVQNNVVQSSPDACQSGDIWCATLQVGFLLHSLDVGLRGGNGVLSDSVFSYDGTQYAAEALYLTAYGDLKLGLDPTGRYKFSDSEFDLHLGDHKLNFADATFGEGVFTWTNVSFVWHPGQEVAVRLTEGGGQGAPPDTEPLTASLDSAPERHDGAARFEVRVAFSEDISTSFRDLGDAFTVANGEITNVKRVDKRSDLWSLKVTPGGDDPVSLTLEAGQDCGEEQAPCTADGRSLSETLTIRVPGPEAPASLTAHLSNQPTEHDGAGSFEVWVGFSHGLRNSEDALRGYPTVTGGTLESASRVDGRDDLWKFTIEPGGDGDVGFSMAAAGQCSDEDGVPCSEEGRPLSNDLSTTINGPTLISVADAVATEGGTMAFTVSLSRAPAAPISVDYRTGDGTAAAGEDYTAASGAVTFLPTQRTKTVSVSLLDDGESEDEETFTLTLSSPSVGRLSDAQATGLIADDDVEDTDDEGEDAAGADTARDGATDLGDITYTGKAAYSRLQSLDGEDETDRLVQVHHHRVQEGDAGPPAAGRRRRPDPGNPGRRHDSDQDRDRREQLQFPGNPPGPGPTTCGVDSAEVARNDYKLTWRTSEAE